MSVELWVGQDFQTTHEREALSRFLADMDNKYGQSDDLYLILANYFVDGRQIDLTVLKNDAVIIIELKDCSAPFRATENGPWQTIPDGNVIGTGNQNPFEQARDYRFRLANFLQRHENNFLLSGKGQDINFLHVSAFVAVSPSLHPDHENYLPNPPWFRLVSLDELSEAVHHQTSRRLHFSDEELRTLANNVLNLRQDNTYSHQLKSKQKPTLSPLKSSQAQSIDGIPEQIGRYKVQNLLGRGGMGAVYHAYDPNVKREVVVKCINPSASATHKEWRQRFEREVQAAGQLKHQHIVTIHDVDLENEPPYIVMELLTGGTLEERLQQQSLPWRDVLKLLRPLAQCLAYAHKSGVIHRDVKPANVMFAGDETDTLKLVDFGLARWQEKEKMTQTGTVIGTLDYMSPEQARGEAVDARTDVFALGIVLFEAIVGRNPLHKESTIATLLELASDTQIDLLPLLDKAPQRVVDLIVRATAKDREERYPDCEALLVDLDLCLEAFPDEVTTPLLKPLSPDLPEQKN